MKTLKDPRSIDTYIAGALPTLVLFGMSYCPFFKDFKPCIAGHCKKKPKDYNYLTVYLDDMNGPLWDLYDIEVSPTLLIFKNGKVIKRFDGIHGRGLDASVLKKL
jgi:hypothetical protein